MGKDANQRKVAGIFTYVKPKDAIQKDYNKEALERLEIKSATNPAKPCRVLRLYPKAQINKLKNNKKEGNRHL